MSGFSQTTMFLVNLLVIRPSDERRPSDSAPPGEHTVDQSSETESDTLFSREGVR
jgi:hypothetical protein